MFPTRCWTKGSEIFIKELFPSRSPGLLRNTRLKVHSIRRHDKRRTQAMIMSASRSLSIRVPGWNSVKTDLITAVSKCLLKNWRACYAEHQGNEQVLLHQELYRHALQVQQNPCIVQRIRRRLDEELIKDNEYRSSYMMHALNYLDHF